MTIRTAAQQRRQLDFWPELRTASMATAARLHAPVSHHCEAAALTPQEHSGACPQRSEDSRRGASRRVSPSSNTGMNK
jgi:hypothetical protein